MLSNGAVEPMVPTPQEKLQSRLSDPRTVDSLNRLLDRVDMISDSMEMLDSFLRRGSEVADNVAESVEEIRGTGDREEIHLIEKLPKLARAGSKMADVADSPSFDRLLESGLLERLAEPGTIQGITTLLDNLELLAFLATSLDGFVRRSNEIADSASESMDDLHSLVSSVNLDEIKQVASELPQLTEAGHKLIQSGLLGKMSELTEAGMMLSKAGFFDPETVQPLADVGRMAAESYVAAKAVPQRKRYGVFALMGVLKDRDVQKGVHIAVEMARQFGRKMS